LYRHKRLFFKNQAGTSETDGTWIVNKLDIPLIKNAAVNRYEEAVGYLGTTAERLRNANTLGFVEETAACYYRIKDKTNAETQK
jgi:hypothetical protein